MLGLLSWSMKIGGLPSPELDPHSCAGAHRRFHVCVFRVGRDVDVVGDDDDERISAVSAARLCPSSSPPLFIYSIIDTRRRRRETERRTGETPPDAHRTPDICPSHHREPPWTRMYCRMTNYELLR